MIIMRRFYRVMLIQAGWNFRKGHHDGKSLVYVYFEEEPGRAQVPLACPIVDAPIAM
jgi:hypothetical protein